jgi:hypothetical protein
MLPRVYAQESRDGVDSPRRSNRHDHFGRSRRRVCSCNERSQQERRQATPERRDSHRAHLEAFALANLEATQ